jgi:hypothetical protein
MLLDILFVLKPFITRNARPKAAVAAVHHRIRVIGVLRALAFEAIAIVRLLMRRIAVLIVPNQMLVSRAAAAKAAG